jgi:hypothetical protein
MRDLGMEMCSVLMIAPAASRRGFPAPPATFRIGAPVSSAKVDPFVVGRQDVGMVQAKSASRFSSQSRGGQSRINYEFRSPCPASAHDLAERRAHLRGRSPIRSHHASLGRSGASLYELVHTGRVLFCRASLGRRKPGRRKDCDPAPCGSVSCGPGYRSSLLRQHGWPSARDVTSAVCGSGISDCLEAPARGAG